MNLYQFPFDVEVSEIKAEIDANPNCWGFSKGRQFNSYEQRNTAFIPLRRERSRRGVADYDNHDTYSTLLFPYFPKTIAFVEWFIASYGGECGRIAIVALKATEDVALHYDHGEYYRKRDRFHLVLQGVYEYEVEGQKQVFSTGSLFYFDSQKRHRAKNLGEEERLVLIFDIEGSKFRDYINN